MGSGVSWAPHGINQTTDTTKTNKQTNQQTNKQIIRNVLIGPLWISWSTSLSF